MITPNPATRPGRMLAALIASENSKGKVEVTIRLTPNDPTKPALHRAFVIRKWFPKDSPEKARLFVSLPDTADWNAYPVVKPVTPITVDLQTGEIRTDEKDPRITPQIKYAAGVALAYARTGEVGSPANGTVEAKESLLCGHCGLKLKDPVSIDRGIGPVCFGKDTKSTAMKLGAKPGIVAMASQIQLAVAS